MKYLRSILMILTFPMISILTSCAINKNFQAKAGLRYTGTYKIKEIDGNRVKFYGVADTYLIDNDTLKVNDRITINVVRKAKASNQIVKN